MENPRIPAALVLDEVILLFENANIEVGPLGEVLADRTPDAPTTDFRDVVLWPGCDTAAITKTVAFISYALIPRN